MLVLSRHNREEIVIGDDIRITVLNVLKGRVRLGFVAPRDVHIVRGELLTRLPRPESEGITGGSTELAGRDRPMEPGSAA